VPPGGEINEARITPGNLTPVRRPTFRPLFRTTRPAFGCAPPLSLVFPTFHPFPDQRFRLFVNDFFSAEHVLLSILFLLSSNSKRFLSLRFDDQNFEFFLSLFPCRSPRGTQCLSLICSVFHKNPFVNFTLSSPTFYSRFILTASQSARRFYFSARSICQLPGGSPQYFFFFPPTATYGSDRQSPAFFDSLPSCRLAWPSLIAHIAQGYTMPLPSHCPSLVSPRCRPGHLVRILGTVMLCVVNFTKTVSLEMH